MILKFRQKSNFDYMLVGLGNPGRRYEFTRHNAGFLFVDIFCDKFNFSVNRLKFHSLTGQVNAGGKKVLVLKPQTMMNNSGQAVREAADYYNIPPENILVVFDDISLPVGSLRIRRKGSAGGHNGIKSIISHLGTEDFPRIKLGVGEKPHPDYDLADWVLSDFTSAEGKKLREAADNAVLAAEEIIRGNIEEAMSRYSH